ncbi:MAG: AI-2E family transporter [Clostridium sp.]|uniref:AI-2E family transporter n=1 Tax=Clostridium sp. TaxID=1506 RepID=UPI0029080000|nr:AI-2E family transporter [Clostridium sp.]
MKINWNTKYNTIAVYAFLVTCGVCIFYLAISQLGTFTAKIGKAIGVLQPFIIGFSIAYILNFLLKFYENRILEMAFFKRLKLKSKRGLGLLFTYVTAFFLLYLFMHFVFPQVVESIVGLVNDIPIYIANLSNLFDKIVTNLELRDEYIHMITRNFNEMSNYIIKLATNLLPVLGSAVTAIASSVWNIILGLIISIYLLIDKEKFFGISKKITYAIFSTTRAERILELTRRSNSTFGKFLSGKILDSTIIGILTFIILTVFKIPYTLLISFIVAVTNIIPFFGPFIGAIPSVIIILFVSPIKALWFLLIIFIIQQIDGNIIGPKILGDSIGISAFWILFSIMIAGKFLGFVGMVIGVPLFAVIYSVVKENVEAKLEKKGLETETKKYI